MIKGGSSQPEGAVEQYLPGGGFEQVLPADDFRDLHRGIIHDHGEVVSGGVIMPPDNEIAEVSARNELLRAVVAVHEGDVFAVGNAEAEVGAGCRLKVESCR